MFCTDRVHSSPTSPARAVAARVRVDDPQLDPGIRLARGAQQARAGPSGIVVGAPQLGDRAGRLGEAVHLDERAAERLHRADQHLVGDRRGAVDDRAQRASSRRSAAPGTAAGTGAWPARRARSSRGAARAPASTSAGTNSRKRIEWQPFHMPQQRPARSADVEQRHGDQVHRRRVEAPRAATCGRMRAEVLVGEHRALRQAGRARGVELHRHVVRRRRQARDPPGRWRPTQPRSSRAAGWSPSTTIFLTVLSVASISSRWRKKSGPTKRTLASRVVDRVLHLAGARRQFTATFTALILPPPKSTSKYSGPFLSRNATRSCAATPSAASAWATRLERSSISA